MPVNKNQKSPSIDSLTTVRQENHPLEKFYTSARWYDETGAVIGAGDVTAGDIMSIMKRLSAGHLFIMIDSRQDWIGPTEPDRSTLDDLFEKAPFVISHDGVYFVAKSAQDLAPAGECCGVKFKIVDRSQASRILECGSLSTQTLHTSKQPKSRAAAGH